MEIRTNAAGARRKELVKAIAEAAGTKAKYMGMPSAAYEIGNCTVTKDGTITFAEGTDRAEAEKLIEAARAAGFECEPQSAAEGLTVTVPRASLTDGAIENLKKLVEAKASLLKKALGTESLAIEVTDEKVAFPWFNETDADHAKAYTHLVQALCEIARNAKRVTSTDKAVDNEKYAFRCFLLRLGFIGTQYKAERKILLKNLAGSSAFKNGGATHEISQ